MNFYKKSLEEFTTDFYAGATTGIIVSSCLGSVAAMMILMGGTSLVHMIELSLVVIVCMWYNASVMAQLKSKFVFNSLIFSLLLSSIFIVVNLF
ncbi:MAG: hypothetical protein WCD31_01575 [Gillisia sp.]